MIIRPITDDDLPALQAIAVESGPGFSSLVDDHVFLEQKIAHAMDSFRRSVEAPDHEGYLFVLEDPDTGDIMGTTGIEAAVGHHNPLYHFQVSSVRHRSPELGLASQQEVLHLCNHYTGCSEVCSLFLRPQFRRANAGRLLSRVRFLFMAQHPERFADTVIAEMRGVSGDNGESPFWQAFQRRFVDLDFETVTRLAGLGHTRAIAEMMPRHPIYSRFLDDAACRAIGEVHEQTRPARQVLESEGFRYTGYVDPFDAGPTLEVRRDDIRSIRDSIRCAVQPLDDADATLAQAHGTHRHETIAIANGSVTDFRATVTDQAIYLPRHNRLLVPGRILEQLNCANGDTIGFTRLSPAAQAAMPQEVYHAL